MWSIIESTTGKYITIVGISDVTLGVEGLRKVFADENEAKNVAGFCNAAISDSFTLVQEQELTVCAWITGFVGYDIEDLSVESDNILESLDEVVSDMDFGELEDIEWVSSVDEYSAVAKVNGRVLVHVWNPTINIDSILEAADAVVANMDFGGLEDIEWSYVYIDDANKNRIYRTS